jgi:bifunctional UDP-N-acetylglucosamine pyrophosphorylase/glucosamine-1-phosphate N-acetyltransferase
MTAAKSRKTVAAKPLGVVILAAGEGKRMRSDMAKVMHPVAGKPMLHHVLDAVRSLRPDKTIVVVGHDGDRVRASLDERVQCVEQAEQLGTGHAVMQARPALKGFSGDVLVLAGDVPLLSAGSLRAMRRLHTRKQALVTALSMIVDDPDGYGRIVRDADGIRIVEHSDASESERTIDEVNTSTYYFDSRFLFRALGGLGNDNAQGEYYLTDVMEAASKKGLAECHVLAEAFEGTGINDRTDLFEAEAAMQSKLVSEWMDKGVTFIDPATAYLSVDVRIGRDATIGPNVRLEGATRIGRGAVLDGSIYLKDTVVGDGVLLRWGVVGDSAKISKNARIGPYSHLRPDAALGEDVHIGNFVEVKKSKIGDRSKANHLAYIGDSTVGRDVNIGAGTITCNYDGVDKHPTTIGDRVQIGSDTQLVAPVKLGADSYVAAGSTISRDLPAGSLGFNDKSQKVRKGWTKAFLARKAAKSKPARRRGK